MRPIVTFTFDDGTRDHLALAAPILEKYGYRGIFNVIAGCSLRGEKFEGYDCLLPEEIKALIVRGHEVASHSVDHVNMRELWFREGVDGCRKQLDESARMLEQMSGVRPRFFCYPYNRGCPMVSRLVREAGMIPYNPISRPNVGAYNWPSDADGVRKKLEQVIFSGLRHVDLMFHGVMPGAGWNSFDDPMMFETIVSCIHDFEMQGRLVVARYRDVHFDRQFDRLVECVACWVWPLAYRLKQIVRGGFHQRNKG